MTIREYAKDVAIGVTISAIIGPIGAVGTSRTTSIASKVGTEGVKQGAVKLAGRTAVIADAEVKLIEKNWCGYRIKYSIHSSAEYGTIHFRSYFLKCIL